MTFSVEVTDTKPWFHSEISDIDLDYNSASLSIPLSYSDANGETIAMTATYTLGTNAPVTIPGGIFTKPTSYEIKVTPTSAS